MIIQTNGADLILPFSEKLTSPACRQRKGRWGGPVAHQSKACHLCAGHLAQNQGRVLSLKSTREATRNRAPARGGPQVAFREKDFINMQRKPITRGDGLESIMH
ncbi:unnamed protein product [Gulo gulo]|uniref:Uncharacterized protein n=1 Tax=Gulo gulo TaxID=48420 RepID=A0A9X9LM50_GULGU|nr:unnamed protein product [Gulo gulo]